MFIDCKVTFLFQGDGQFGNLLPFSQDNVHVSANFSDNFTVETGSRNLEEI